MVGRIRTDSTRNVRTNRELHVCPDCSFFGLVVHAVVRNFTDDHIVGFGMR